MYRLGLDLGTNSIGWCALRLDEENQPNGILAAGVRLLTPNQEAGRDPQSKTSLAADRRAARSARRRRDRFLRRQKRLMKLLVDAGLMPEDEAGRKNLESLNPYELRARALDEALQAHSLGRAFFHLNQRRGFKSNRIADADDSDKGVVKEGMRALEEALKADGARTLGEFLWQRHRKRRPVRFRPTAKGSKVLYDLYPKRDLVEHEIDAIWTAQKPHHPQLTDELLAQIKYVVIGQRDLKKPAVGRCTFRPEEPRAARALPVFQRFRILQDLSSLEIERPGIGSRKLSVQERDALASLLMSQASQVKFEKMRRALKLSEDARFNYEASHRKGFDPDLTAARLAHKDAFGRGWRSLGRDRQSEIVEKLLSTADEDVLLAWLEQDCGLEPAKAEEAVNLRLPQGHSNLGGTILVDLVDVLETEQREAIDPATGEIFAAPLTYDEAVNRLGLHHSDHRPGELLKELPYYGDVMKRHVIEDLKAPEESQDFRGRVPNPTVHIALNQMRRLVNALIAEHGPPRQVVIELARELKWNKKRKEEYNRQLADNTKANERRRVKLAELGQDDNGENRLRFRLYEELPPDERVCVYTGKPISYGMLFSDQVEIDHILPFSKTLDDSFANKVLCLRAANRRKGNRAPADAYSGDELREIAERAERLFRPKTWRFQPDAMEQFEDKGGWQARHLTDTQHMARLAKAYLAHVCPDVWAVPGRMTAMLRGLWGLNGLLGNEPAEERAKSRTDHRHHAIDAFVIACTERRLLQRIAQEAGRAEELQLHRLFGVEGVPAPFDGYRDTLREVVRSILVSHKADHGPQGQLHEETAYGSVDEEIDGKRFNLVTRKPIASLTEREIFQVRDPAWRARLMDLAEKVKVDGSKLSEALEEFGRRHGIRRIRVLKTEKSAITVRHGSRREYEKAYVPGDNHRMEIFQLPGGEWDGEAVSVFQANQHSWTPEWRKRHPDAKLIMRVHKGDVLDAELGTASRYWVVYRINPAANRFWVAPHEDAGDQSTRSWQRPTIKRLQDSNARRVRVDTLGRVHPVEERP
ncbi:MAG: type II CRISPR RNA-guided endonuclease Cas9 [Kiloniellales bacterium]|nr:type II CRISPR RNA-guided endonuclease Cas9 [Kiloniellales bacterium]